MNRSFFYILITLITFNSYVAISQTHNSKELEASIDALIPHSVKEDTPGLVIGVVKNNKLIFSKGYGLANMAYNIPNDPKMAYNIGSVSKQFLGYAFAMLHVDGTLNLNDEVGDYLDDWPKFDQKVTLKHLLSHTSGYREAYTPSVIAGRSIGVDRLTKKECLDVVRKQPSLEFTPGDRYTYNSTAWVILAEVLEKVVGQPADAWVEEHILKPLEMNDTHIESFVGEVIPNAAESYSLHSGDNYEHQRSNRAIFGAADIVSSVEDLAKWLNHLDHPKIASEEVHKVFLDPFILNNGINSQYALGIYNGEYKGLKRYRHTGGHEAFITHLSFYPEHDLGIIMISNFGGQGVVASSDIAELFLKEEMNSDGSPEKPFDINVSALKLMEGNYISERLNNTVELKLSDNKLTLGGRINLIPSSNKSFKLEGREIKIQFDDADEETGSFVIKTSNSIERFNKSTAWKPATKELEKYTGMYFSNELETFYYCEMNNDAFILKHRWNGTLTLQPISKDFFRTNYGAFVMFHRNDDGNIKGLSFYSSRTLDVRFDLVSISK